MSRLLELTGAEVPVFQAGMGGGVSRHELAAAVAEAGGLGTLGTDDPPVLERELLAARALTSKPIAVNLLLPFARPAHWRVARQADAVVTFWGRPVRRSPGVWLHQCGSIPSVPSPPASETAAASSWRASPPPIPAWTIGSSTPRRSSSALKPTARPRGAPAAALPPRTA